MTTLAFHHEARSLPTATEDLMPVQLYGNPGAPRRDVSSIGSPIVDRIKRLGISIPEQTMDFLTLALAVTAADTFVCREFSENGWTRRIGIQLPLSNPDTWNPLKRDLEDVLHFLSGDIWSLEFSEGGFRPPTPFGPRYNRFNLRGLDCVSLFSGGLDSAVGSIDLTEEGRNPLLVSHSYPFDRARQESVFNLLNGTVGRIPFNAHPRNAYGKNELSMRTRSFNFLALAALASNSIQTVNQLDTVDLFVPENGFISLNAPLTARRIGSLSTRTTHPHFIEGLQDVFDAAGISVNILNPYQFKTKGRMLSQCRNQELLSSIVDRTVSCSHWKRSNQQCGACVPCIIRRSAIYSSGIYDDTTYRFQNILDVLRDDNQKDDLLAIQTAIARSESQNTKTWLLTGGLLPIEHLDDYSETFLDGLNEIQNFLYSEGAL